MKTIIVALAIMVLATDARAAQVCVTIPDAVVDDVLNAFSEKYHWPETVEPTPQPGTTPGPGQVTPVPNPETKAAFTRRVILEWMADTVAAYRGERSGDAARSYRERHTRALLRGDPVPTAIPTP